MDQTLALMTSDRQTSNMEGIRRSVITGVLLTSKLVTEIIKERIRKWLLNGGHTDI
jgi:hypothetical protein